MDQARVRKMVRRIDKALHGESPSNIGPALSTAIVNFLQGVGVQLADHPEAIDAIAGDAKLLASDRLKRAN